MGFYTNIATYIEALCVDKGLKFYERSWDEFFGSIHDTEYPCLLLDKPDFTFQDAFSDNVLKKREIGFIIADHVYDKEDTANKRTQIDNAESLVDAVLNQMRHDTKAPYTTPLRGFDFNNVEAVCVENPAAGAFGYSVVCIIETKHDTSI